MHKTVKMLSMALCAFMVAVLVAGCGGGGGGPSISQYAGTYRGTYFVPEADNGGTLSLIVNSSGSATAILSGGFENPTGKVSSSGRLDLSASQDAEEGRTLRSRLTGQISLSDNRATGQITFSSPQSSKTVTGTFSATRTSAASNLQKQLPGTADGKALHDAIKKALHAPSS